MPQQQQQQEQEPPLCIQQQAQGIKRPAVVGSMTFTSLLGFANRPRLSGAVPTRWNVSDVSLRPVPAFGPPLDSNCTVYVADSSPSIVATRLSEALRQRSVSVEFDDDAGSASAMTAERVFFTIQLYRGSKVSKVEEETLDFSRGVIVNILKIRGESLYFHKTCRALLKSAIGFSDGTCHKVYCPFSLDRWDEHASTTTIRTSSAFKSANTTTIASLEHVMSLLKKDRIGAQELGLRSLVILTDPCSSGNAVACSASMAVLGAPMGVASDVSTFVQSMIRDRKLPGEEEDVPLELSFDDSVAPSVGISSSAATSHKQQRHAVAAAGSIAAALAEHASTMRSLALRVLSNALTILARERASVLTSVLMTHGSIYASVEMLSALLDDLSGATRPPSVLFASAHDAALSCKCLAVLMDYSKEACKRVVTLRSKTGVLDAFDRAEEVGALSHTWLERQARCASAAFGRGVGMTHV
eukprot:CAMPEP_0118704598 /NCGR_PEP_ID=MMETSP0800-20121206/19331_1 /TAXON_ID=210618 ORGANISM="Striatella unipunctata, Strain CCMP2910" /NCGR_SAMPLE_ID=MMETSP0800 /ASSEMBLY_ACC=CAM_ASM_000638 /LENGTH=470 /DNA_ID=CAMNT_0006606519 /DNA_START=118 /DNA_END=1530 /DNA_ORIENTATION=-